MPAIYSSIGLALNLVGVIVLFRYGMPYRVRTGGDLLISPQDTKVIDVEHNNLGLFGLGAVLIGTVFQIIGTIVPH